jgi:hypothetical protein
MSLMRNYTNFYIATATIMPILFILFAIQNTDILRVRVSRGQVSSDRLLGVAVSVGLLIIAESAALAGLLGFQSMWFVELSIIGLGFSFTAITSSYLVKQIKETVIEMKADPSWKLREERVITRMIIYLTILIAALPGIITIVACISVWSQ